jgi:hypothetical protein
MISTSYELVRVTELPKSHDCKNVPKSQSVPSTCNLLASISMGTRTMALMVFLARVPTLTTSPVLVTVVQL